MILRRAVGGERRGGWVAVFAIVVLVVVALAGRAGATACGDADLNGSVTVSDAVQILRSAADLTTTCSNRVCDVDSNNQVGVTDAVNVLRRVADLSANVTCRTGISDFITDVAAAGGDHGVLEIGVAPVPGPGAPQTVGDPQGPTTAPAGSQNDITVPFDTTGASQVAAAAAGGGLILVVAVGDLDANLTDGFFELPLGSPAGQIDLVVTYPTRVGHTSFLFCPATRQNGVLSQYGALRQDPVPGQANAVHLSITFPQ